MSFMEEWVRAKLYMEKSNASCCAINVVVLDAEKLRFCYA